MFIFIFYICILKGIILKYFNLYATELNPISHFLALLGAHPKVHISRIKVNLEKVHFVALYCTVIQCC
jgi:hypothetical protein